MQFFQTNIEALQIHHPQLAQSLLNVSEVSDFEIFMDANELVTLNFVHTKHFTPLYEGSPAQTIGTQIQEFASFAKYPYLYMYGFGNGALIHYLLREPLHRRIVVIEPEIELLYIVLHMIDFQEAIHEGRLVIFGMSDVTFPNTRALFNLYQEQKYAKVYDLHIASSYYERHFEDHIRETNRRLIEGLYHAINAAGNDAKDALIGLKHHIINLPRLLDTPPLIDMLNKLNTTDTAVLVATGPSLTKQLPLLKSIAPYVRIIAVDASFPVLYKAGIKPDVVVSMERVKESAKFFEQVPLEGYKDVVIALSSLQHKDVIDAIKGGTLQISLRPLGYMMVSGPKEWGYMGIGTSAANMGFELIYYSKFKNCILIGQDLAYGQDGTSHAKEHVFGDKEVQTKESDVWVEGWGGENKVRTNHNWTMFRNFFEKDIADIKDAMLTINATEGGARIFGAAELSFAQAIESYVDTKKKKEPLRLAYMPQTRQKSIALQTWEKVDEIKNYVEELLETTKDLFLDVAKTSEQEIQKIESARLQELLYRVEAIKEKHSEEMFEHVVWHIAQSMMLVQEIDIAPAEVFLCEDEALEKERLYHLIHQYKSWLFSFAGVMDAILKTIEYAKERMLINEVERIDVYKNDKKIDTFTCRDLDAKSGLVFDVDMRGILYDPQGMYEEMIESLVFKDAKSGAELPRAFVSVISKNDEKYNELRFMKTLEEPIDLQRLKYLYTPHAIGFIATKENAEDLDFIAYVNELMQRFPTLTLKVFYFATTQKEQVQDLLSFPQRTVFLVPQTLYDIVSEVQVFLEGEYTLDKRVLHLIVATCENILVRRYGSQMRTNMTQESDYASQKKIVLENLDAFGFRAQELHDFYYPDLLNKKLLEGSEIEYREADRNKTRYENKFFVTVGYALESLRYVNNNFRFNALIRKYKKKG